MPKERRNRLGAHLPSAKLAKRHFALPEKPEHIDIGASTDLSGNDILRDLTHETATQEPSTKKEKQQLKRDALLRRLEFSRLPYSKSHERRLKRKAKEQIAGGLNEMQAVISAIEKDTILADAGSAPERTVAVSSLEQKSKTQIESGQIAAGKNAPLSKAQRKRVLQLERLRHPLILSNPAFISSPFQAIRTHLQNTQMVQGSST